MQDNSSISGLLVSQVGAARSGSGRIVWRSTSGEEPPALWVDGESERWVRWGEKWGAFWWTARAFYRGKTRIEIRAGEFIEELAFGENPLWEETWRAVGVDSLRRRAKIAKNGRGWLDCGSHWQEANSHACCLLGLLDVLEFRGSGLSVEEREDLCEQIRVGVDLLEWYQDLAAELPGGRGALVHEVPEHRDVIVFSDVSKAAAVFARAARFAQTEEEQSRWKGRAQAACKWLESAAPPGGKSLCAAAHGVPEGTMSPGTPMTRDLLMELWARIELDRLDGGDLSPRARQLAEEILERQFTRVPEGITLTGQFATFAGWERPEPAWTHFLSKDVLGDVGATYPHWLVPLLRIVKWWPDDPLAQRARQAVHKFAYGYFLPACEANPFLILPLGEFPGEGLIWFAGLWHGMNSTYGLAAALAFEFGRFFNDHRFLAVAEGNLQWIAGLNAGLAPGVELGCELSTPETVPGRALPVSMIYGIGRRYFGSWKTIKGSVSSGFFAGRSFQFDVPPRHEFDAPSSFADEDWITFNGAWLSGISRIPT